ncbi:GvpL/GvpF family gas vesicle protein [Pelorhabdus rhamnosifermentans]|uniref:GvpL/GvpF family gas vesicle protein n=1 Tax=Pelorhabdus rhamnosifermentans TaxID=2772457 RepID=UPI001C0639CC|nr:GvpL/GvpF family gas vesicle protein [Pelorhabdus rhamnosifermentans]
MSTVNGTGKYVYCIIESAEPLTFAAVPISGGQRVFTVHYQDLAAVVSESNLKKYTVNREHVIAHQKVLEAVLSERTLLPVRYGTVTETENDIIKFLLQPRYKELKGLLKHMNDKNQYGLRVLWSDEKQVFKEILEENYEIKKLKNKLSKITARRSLDQQIELGHMVEAALIEKKEVCRLGVMKPLSKIACEVKENELYGNHMFVNANFLIEKSRQDEFAGKINALAESYGSGVLFKYIGPIPPYNFVEIIVNLKDGRLC